MAGGRHRVARFWQKGPRSLTDRTFILICLLLSLIIVSCRGDDGSVSPAASGTAGQPGDANVLKPLDTGRDVLAPDGRYSLRVPGEWVQYDDPIAELAFRTVAEDPALALNIVREDLGENQRPQVYAEDARRRIGSIYSNVVSLSLSPVRIGALEAFRWVYTATAGAQERFFYQLFVIDGGQGFVVTGVAPIDADFTTTRSLFDAIVGSLTFARGSAQEDAGGRTSSRAQPALVTLNQDPRSDGRDPGRGG